MRTHHMRPATWHRIYTAIFGVGLALIAIATIDVAELALFRFGVLLAIIGGVRTVVDKVATDDESMEAGRQSGYDDGYEDGCEDGREIRPTSKFSAVSPAVTRLPSSLGPSQQLVEHGDVGDGQQRIV